MAAQAQITVTGVVPPIVRVTPINSECSDVYANIEVNIYTVEGNSVCPVLKHCKVCSLENITVGVNE